MGFYSECVCPQLLNFSLQYLTIHRAHKTVLQHRNLWNDGADCCRAVMVVSKQGRDSEWQGVSVLSVYVFVARHRLCVSLSDCLTVGGCACVAAHWYVWVPFCPLCMCRSQVMYILYEQGRIEK